MYMYSYVSLNYRINNGLQMLYMSVVIVLIVMILHFTKPKVPFRLPLNYVSLRDTESSILYIYFVNHAYRTLLPAWSVIG